MHYGKLLRVAFFILNFQGCQSVKPTFNTISIEQEIGLNLTPPQSSQIHLQLRQQSLLDVGDHNRLRSVHKERLDHTTLDVDQESSGQRGAKLRGQFLGGGWGLGATAGAVNQLIVDHDEFRVHEFQSGKLKLIFGFRY